MSTVSQVVVRGERRGWRRYIRPVKLRRRMDWLVIALVTLAAASVVAHQWILGAGLAVAVGILEWARLKTPTVEDQSFRIERPRWRSWFLWTWTGATALFGLIFALSGDGSLASDVAAAITSGASVAGFFMWLIWTRT
jgi:hypothetical protein